MRIRNKKRSFKQLLLISFCLISIIPLALVNIVSYYNIAIKVQQNVDEMKTFSLEQTKRNVSTVISSYEDLLYQLYTDDDVVSLVDKIDKGVNVAVSKNQLRRKLTAVANVKPYVQSVTVITKKDNVLFYDKLATPTKSIVWIDKYSSTPTQLYNQISSTNDTYILPTKYADTFDAHQYYLFHIAHRVIDYRNINKKNSVVILSIDERMLNEIYRQNMGKEGSEKDNLHIIVDDNGNIISFEDTQKIGIKIVNNSASVKQQKEDYIRFIKDNNYLNTNNLKVYTVHDDILGWTFVNVSDQSLVVNEMRNQQQLTIIIFLASVIMLIVIIYFITGQLSGSINKIVKAMKKAERGELSVRVEADEHMPVEIETIAHQFNSMLEELNDSIEKEKEASIKQRNAEISALEAQINPHFLYNTLDTINWMAIDKDEYEISNAINSLAKILRYGVDKSNGVVEIRQEVDWLKKYLFLQQTRLKNTFECILNIDPEVMNYHIHKLLLQPFVENAIIHGFEGVKRKHILEISMSLGEETIHIRIGDNGKGIPQDKLEEIRCGILYDKEEKCHIGITNAINRLKMYYGNQANVEIGSTLGEGTSIDIDIPKI